MSKIWDTVFTYDDKCTGTSSRFRLRVYQSQCAFLTAIATELPLNPGVRVDFIDAHLPVTHGNLVGVNAAVYEAIGLANNGFAFFAHLPGHSSRRKCIKQKRGRFFLRSIYAQEERAGILDYLKARMLLLKSGALPVPSAFVTWLLRPVSRQDSCPLKVPNAFYRRKKIASEQIGCTTAGRFVPGSVLL